MNRLKTVPPLLVLAAALAWGMRGGAADTGSSALDLARRLNQAFIEVADQVSPSVVVIRVAHKPEYDLPDLENHPFFDLPPEMKQRFREELEKRRRDRQRRGPELDGEGSGIILREDGYLLTNSHVVDGAEKIAVQLKSGKEFEQVQIVGVDPQSDVAVLKIEARELPAARLGDSSKTRVGEFAIAIGAPFNLDYSVTFGHVSAKGRRVLSPQRMWDQDFLQTDASINPGNSGGPLVNIDGEVIGLNTLISGMNSGIGFAVPINLAREVAAQIIQKGRFSRAVLGIEIRTLGLDKEYRDQVTAATEGVVVRRILPWSPVADSDLEAGDVIVAVGGKPVATAEQLQAEVRTQEIGKPVTLEVVRNNQRLKIQVKPGELPAEASVTVTERSREAGVAAKSLGCKVQTLTPELAKQFEVEVTQGVLVTEVESESAAADKGLAPGDVITHVDRKRVGSVREFSEALKAADLKKGVLLNLVNAQGRRFEVLKETGD
jgi:serine protease Do